MKGRRKKAHRWIVGSMMSLAFILLFFGCGESFTDREQVLLQNGQDGTMSGTLTGMVEASPSQTASASPASSRVGSESGMDISDDSLTASPEPPTNASAVAAEPVISPIGSTDESVGESDTPPVQSTAVEAPQTEAEIIVRSDNVLSSTEKEELLKELENELDGLFGAIDQVNAEPQPDVPE